MSECRHAIILRGALAVCPQCRVTADEIIENLQAELAEAREKLAQLQATAEVARLLARLDAAERVANASEGFYYAPRRLSTGYLEGAVVLEIDLRHALANWRKLKAEDTQEGA